MCISEPYLKGVEAKEKPSTLKLSLHQSCSPYFYAYTL